MGKKLPPLADGSSIHDENGRLTTSVSIRAACKGMGIPLEEGICTGEALAGAEIKENADRLARQISETITEALDALKQHLGESFTIELMPEYLTDISSMLGFAEGTDISMHIPEDVLDDLIKHGLEENFTKEQLSEFLGLDEDFDFSKYETENLSPIPSTPAINMALTV